MVKFELTWIKVKLNSCGQSPIWQDKVTCAQLCTGKYVGAKWECNERSEFSEKYA